VWMRVTASRPRTRGRLGAGTRRILHGRVRRKLVADLWPSARLHLEGMGGHLRDEVGSIYRLQVQFPDEFNAIRPLKWIP